MIKFHIDNIYFNSANSSKLIDDIIYLSKKSKAYSGNNIYTIKSNEKKVVISLDGYKRAEIKMSMNFYQSENIVIIKVNYLIDNFSMFVEIGLLLFMIIVPQIYLTGISFIVLSVFFYIILFFRRYIESHLEFRELIRKYKDINSDILINK